MNHFSPTHRRPQATTRTTALTGLAAIIALSCVSDPLPAQTAPTAVAPRPATTRGALARQQDFFTLQIYEVPQGTGTGFVWDDEGHIVTNYHVVAGMSRGATAQVVMHDQETYEAELIGASPQHDLAVLKIDPPPSALQPVVVGDSASLKVGQSAYAIGNPFGLSATLSTGTVSALGRHIQSIAGPEIENVVQIDAAINPGNSGGPLYDSAGRVVGVNTAIASTSGTSAGIGFAVPIDTVRRVVPHVIVNGVYTPPRLGIASPPPQVEANLRRRLRIPAGVIVWQIFEGTGAAAAGLQPWARGERVVAGDIIQQIDGVEIRDLFDLQTVLDRYQPGDTSPSPSDATGAPRPCG